MALLEEVCHWKQKQALRESAHSLLPAVVKMSTLHSQSGRREEEGEVAGAVSSVQGPSPQDSVPTFKVGLPTSVTVI